MRPPALTLRHAGGACPIYIGPGLLDELPGLLGALLPGRRVAIMSDDQVAAAVPSPADGPRLTFPAGEASKTRDTWARMTDELLALGMGRDSALIAVGGGVTGDLAGFVAATYLRGIPYVQVPTSLLAMLDASIGGKTGVDVPAGKNLVGAFHQPVAVVVDPRTLRTLPDPDYRAGLAEAVKHAAIADATHFAWLGEHAQALLARDEAALDALLQRSIAIKAAIVSEDEREGGRRAVLNAGHTVAHALETVSGFALRHGEAVAIGLVAEARLGERIGVTAAGTAAALAALLGQLGLPTQTPRELDRAAAIAAMQADKKNRGGALRFSLLRAVGVTAEPWTIEATAGAVRAAL